MKNKNNKIPKREHLKKEQSYKMQSLLHEKQT